MNGFIKHTATVLCLGSLAALGGCCYQSCKLCDRYDNCWLERYSYQAAEADIAGFAPQVHNGHILEQTVFTYHFEPGTDKLTKGGMEHLANLARRRPEPDTHIYLQTAQDVAYDAAAPEQYIASRAELDGKRIGSIQRFLNAETAGRTIVFEVAIHDPPTPGMPAHPIGIAVQKNYASFQGTLPASGGAGGTSGSSTSSGSSGSSSSSSTPH